MEKEGYVSIQAVNDMLEYCRNFDGNDAIYIFEKWFREQEPVQPKMGQWIFDKERLGYWISTCSECDHIFHGNELLIYKPKYCPNCGAKMQEVEE